MSRVRCSSVGDESVARAFDEYAGSHEGPVGMDRVVDWMISNNKWQPEQRALRRELKKILTRIAKSRHYRDAQGRLVRSMHAAKYPKGVDKNGQMIFETMWDYHKSMSAEHARMSFTQRWDQIAGACKSLKRDTDSFNDNNPNARGREVQLAFDFEAVIDSGFEQQVEYIPLSQGGVLSEPLPK